MKKTFDRLLSIMIALILAVTLLPATAFIAAEDVMAADSRSVTVTGEIPGTTEYRRHTGALTSGNAYLIISGSHALTNNNGAVGNTEVTINNYTISGALANEANVLWTFTENNGNYRIENQGSYIGIPAAGGNLNLSSEANNDNSLTVSAQADNTYRISRPNSNRYLRYNNGWSIGVNTGRNLQLYEKTSSGGSQTVELTLSPFVTDITSRNATSSISKTVTVNGSAASSYDLTWSSSDTDTVTVDADGTVTGLARGSAMITATLTKVNGIELATPISASVKVNAEFSLGGTPGTNNRQYPEEGAVKIDKTASSNLMDDYGLSQVELDVAGVGLRPGVDVVLIVDVSNSMEWSLENSSSANEADRRADPGQATKLENAMTAAKSFSRIMLSDNTGSKYDNTVSFVTFAGYDRELSNNAGDQGTYVDSVMTVFTGETDYSRAETSFNGTTLSYTSDYMLKVTDNNGNVLVNGRNRGNTNYDYAFSEASAAVTTLQDAYETKWNVDDYAATGRETYIVFMTDGAPSHYNAQTAAGNQGRDYLPGRTGTYQGGSYNTQALWTDYFLGHRNTYANSLYSQVDGNFYAIGFDLANGGFSGYQWNQATLVQLLETMVVGQTIPVNATADSDELNALYERLATLIKPAGTEAQVIDTVNTKDFTVQMAHTVTGDKDGNPVTVTFPEGMPRMELKTYDLYTAANATEEHPIGSRTGTFTTLETVTFIDAGTEAYSDQFGAGFNIMTTSANGVVTINARYFTYTKDPNTLDANGNPTEKFVWNIGDIPDKEIALSFYVYLKGSLEGEASEGAKYTNESATLSYVDIAGEYVEATYPRPVAVWKNAVTDIEYYLVNKEGKPVNRVGQEVSFDLRVKIGDIQHFEFPLNKSEEHSDVWSADQAITAADYLPEGITEVVLYDANAAYLVRAASGTQVSPLLEISEPSSDATKDGQTGEQTTIDVQAYDRDHSGKPYDTMHLTSHIAFGLRYDLVPGMSLIKDVAVIDYAKPVNIDVLANDRTNIPTGFDASLEGYVAYDSSVTDMTKKYAVSGTGAITPQGNLIPDGASGKFSLYTSGTQNLSHYELTKFMNTVDKAFGTVKFVNKEDATDQYYMYNEIDVMPANNIYYEDDFMAEDNEDATVGFVYTGTWSAGTSSGNTETPNNEVHGGWVSQDPGLSTDTDFSDGSAHKTTKSGAKVTFTFTGTGVDVYTRTDASAGQVRAKLYKVVDGTATQIKLMTMDNYSDSGTYYQIPTLSFGSLDYGTYKLEITAGYVKNADGSKRSTYYIDGIRVYNPIQNQESDSLVAAAYGEAELGATFTVARELLADGSAAFIDQIYKLYYEVGGTKTYVQESGEDILLATGGQFNTEMGMFVDKTDTPIVDTKRRTISVTQGDSLDCIFEEDNITLIVPAGYDVGTEAAGFVTGDYNNSELGKVAPANEIYLGPDNGIMLQTTNNAKGYYLGIKMLDGESTVGVTFGLDQREFTINHSTDLYYKVVPDSDGVISIVNRGSNKVAITKLRIAGAPAEGGEATQNSAPIDMQMAPVKFASFLSLPVIVDAEDVTEEEVEEPDTSVTDLGEEDIVIENPSAYEEADEENEGSKPVVTGLMKNGTASSANILRQFLSRLVDGIRSLFG